MYVYECVFAYICCVCAGVVCVRTFVFVCMCVCVRPIFVLVQSNLIWFGTFTIQYQSLFIKEKVMSKKI